MWNVNISLKAIRVKLFWLEMRWIPVLPLPHPHTTIFLPNCFNALKPSLTLSLFFSLAVPRGMWELSCPNRDRTCAPCIGSAES